MISGDIDLGKARIMLYYLGKSKVKFDEREFSRKKLQLQLRQLKKINTKGMRNKIEQLEFDISEALEKEKRILQKQSKEDIFHTELKQKVAQLEQKLGRYLDTRAAREDRVKALEDKIKKKMMTKQEQASQLRDDLKKMELLYKNAGKSRQIPKTKLKIIKNKIDALKNRLKILRD